MYLEPLGQTITEAAHRLGVTRRRLSQIVNGRASISPAMALRLAKAFENASPQFWRMADDVQEKYLDPEPILVQEAIYVLPEWVTDDLPTLELLSESNVDKVEKQITPSMNGT